MRGLQTIVKITNHEALRYVLFSVSLSLSVISSIVSSSIWQLLQGKLLKITEVL